MSSSLVTNRDYLISLNSGANTLSILGTVTITGDLSVAGNATLSGNILGDRIQNGTTLIDIQTINGNANITVGGVSNVAVFATTGIYAAGVVSATGNISGNYFVGNGSELTGITSSYGNANVAANLAAFGSNPISTTGNVTAGNIIGIHVGNVTGTTVSVTGNVTGGNILTVGLISATGTITSNVNITGGNILTVGLISSAGTITSNGNIRGANLKTPGLISATGNATADYFLGNGLQITGNTATITSANYSIGYLNIPQVVFTGNATIAATDAGKHYYSTLSTANVLIIANNTSVSWAVGTAISLVNRGTGNITVAQDSGVSLYLAGNATAGNRTVTTYGMATLMNVAANIWMINGTGVS